MSTPTNCDDMDVSEVRFDIKDDSQCELMLKYLSEHGYAVISNVASQSEIRQGISSFWDFWEEQKHRGDINRNDMKTWNNWMANATTGILATSRNANHNNFLWNARTLPAVRKTFSKVWDTDNLIVSYDAGGAFRPWQYNIQWLTSGGWWHLDQNSLRGPHRQGRVTVQGLVTYYDATPETGGLCVIPGSHLLHDEVCARAPTAKIGMDYVSIHPTDPILKSARPVLVCAKAGDLILWDSRIVHCNTPALRMANYQRDLLEKKTEPFPCLPMPEDGKGELLRLVAYVCMVPTSHASAEILQQRKQAFLHRLPTPHYPTYEIAFCPEDKIAPWTTRREILQLVGYTDREIRNIQEGRDADQDAPSWVDRVLHVAAVCAILYVLLA